jgi:serine/threonine protein kinase
MRRGRRPPRRGGRPGARAVREGAMGRPCPSGDELAAFHAGALPEDAFEAVSEHLGRCAACAASLASLPLDADPWVRALRGPAAADPFVSGPDCARAVAQVETLVQEATASASYHGPLADEGRPKEQAPPPTATSTVTWPVGADAAEDVPDLPGYEVLDVLGRGAMGVVYRARDKALPRLVALKVVKAGRAATAEQRARFRAEAGALARLRHAHIVPVYDYDEHQGQPYFALEYVEGGSLDKRLGGRPQPPAAAARLVFLLARAVQHAHSCGVVHRDLKPSNVLLAPEADEPGLNSPYGLPKLSDFGLAHCLEEAGAQTAEGAVLGTPSYMAPEQAAGKVSQVGAATDVYALGAILYECLTGQPPFRGESVLDTLEQVRSGSPVPPRRLRPDVPAALEAVVLRCLAKRPEDRYPSAAALAAALQPFQAGQTTDDRPTDPTPPDRRKWWRRVAVAAAGVLAVGLVGLAVAFGPWGGGGETGHPPQGGTGAPKPPPALEPLKGSLDLRVTQKENPRRQKLLLHQPLALPLRPGDRMEIEAEVNRPAYLYLVYLDSQGRATPLFPWRGFDWKRRPAEERRLRLFQEGPLDPGPSGVESLLLLIREEPLPGEADLPALFAGLPKQKGLPDRRARAWFENGELVRDDPERGPPRLIGQGDPREDPLVQAQALLRDRLRTVFPYTRAVCFAFQGD